MITIVTELHDWVPVVVFTYGDIFQSKLNELLSNIKVVDIYIDDILIISKYNCPKHIEQLRVIFARINNAVLKFNAKRCSLGLKVIPYLGYIITWEIIKSDPKNYKVSWILLYQQIQTK